MKTVARIVVLAALVGAPVLGVRSGVVHAQSGTERTIDIVVEGAYRPARITILEGERVRLRFVRRDYTPCTQDVVFPTLGTRRTLPTNDPVVVELPALAPGEYPFHCGMHMIRGTLVVVGR